MPNAQNLTQAIVDRHAALGLPSNTDAQASPKDDTPYEVAFAASRRLGFIPADADCIALAWAKQTERTGRFDTQQWPCDAQDFGLAPRGPDAFAEAPKALGVYAVLPTAAWVGRMAHAGLTTVQLRFKSPDTQAVRTEIFAAVEAVKGTGAHLYINDHWELAIEAGAYGVHLGQEDLDTLSSQDLSRIREAGLRLGLSTHGYAEMVRAASVGPSYVAMGAVFPTTLKAMPTPPQGLVRLAAYAQLVKDWPLVAIGGINHEHLPAIASTGVGSFAVVRAITGTTDAEAVANGLQAQWARLRSHQFT